MLWHVFQPIGRVQPIWNLQEYMPQQSMTLSITMLKHVPRLDDDPQSSYLAIKALKLNRSETNNEQLPRNHSAGCEPSPESHICVPCV